MMNSSVGDLDAIENYYWYNDATEHTERLTFSDVEEIVWTGITLTVCCVGFVGNGYIIWLLGFQMKRNCFTTFILNLAIADFGFLTCVVIFFIYIFTDFLGGIFNFICSSFSHMMYINAHFLMTAISIDRCVAVLFPIWHRCSRPKHLSPAVCVFSWIASFLLVGTMIVTKVILNDSLSSLHFLVTAMVCLPLITLSTVVLFIKLCLKSNQKNQGRLLWMILITLLCFLILSFPLSVFAVIASFFSIKTKLVHLILLFSCLNSSINPVIYFLVGRKKGARSKESMKVRLQNVFKEGEATGGR